MNNHVSSTGDSNASNPSVNVGINVPNSIERNNSSANSSVAGATNISTAAISENKQIPQGNAQG